jgi:cobalamin biosynthesis protein CobD/CbiB
MLSKDILKMITREAGKDVAVIAQKTEEATKAKADLKKAEDSFEEKVAAMDRRVRETMSTGVESAAMGGALGFGLGGGAAYLLHDTVAGYFGRGTWTAMLVLPVTGAVTLAVVPSMLKDRKSAPGENASARAGAYGAGLGLLSVGGYLSYEDYKAIPAAKS